jgi:hypothetical protein
MKTLFQILVVVAVGIYLHVQDEIKEFKSVFSELQ